MTPYEAIVNLLSTYFAADNLCF